MKFIYGVCIGKDASKVETLKKIGCDFCEVGFSALADAPDGEVQAMADQCKKHGIKCLSANGFIPARIRLTGPDVDDAVTLKYLEESFEKLSVLGLKSVIFGSGGARNIPEGFSREEAKAQIVHFLRDLVAPLAEKHGVIVGIEELNDKESNVLNTCAEAMEYVREVNSPYIKLLVDLYHVLLMNESVESLADYKGDISHVHIASPSQNRHVPSPTDPEDYEEFFRVLKAAEYESGAISLEGNFGGDFEGSARVAIEYLRSVEAKINV